MSALDDLMSKAYDGGKVAGLSGACEAINLYLRNIPMSGETRNVLEHLRIGLSAAANAIEVDHNLPSAP